MGNDKCGFWEVNTAAHIDWPQQSRLVEMADNRDGTLSVIVTIVDTAAPPSYSGRLSGPWTWPRCPANLASTTGKRLSLPVAWTAGEARRKIATLS